MQVGGFDRYLCLLPVQIKTGMDQFRKKRLIIPYRTDRMHVCFLLSAINQVHCKAMHFKFTPSYEVD